MTGEECWVELLQPARRRRWPLPWDCAQRPPHKSARHVKTGREGNRQCGWLESETSPLCALISAHLRFSTEEKESHDIQGKCLTEEDVSAATQWQKLSALKLKVSSQCPIFSPVHYGEICPYFGQMETFPQTSPSVVSCLALLNSLITSLVYSKWWFHFWEKKKKGYLNLAGLVPLFLIHKLNLKFKFWFFNMSYANDIWKSNVIFVSQT